MIYLIDFFTIFGVLIAIMLFIVSISNIVSYFRGKKIVKLFTKEKLKDMTWSLLKVTLMIFILRQAILYDGLWWLVLIIVSVISEINRDKKNVNEIRN